MVIKHIYWIQRGISHYRYQFLLPLLVEEIDFSPMDTFRIAVKNHVTTAVWVHCSVHWSTSLFLCRYCVKCYYVNFLWGDRNKRLLSPDWALQYKSTKVQAHRPISLLACVKGYLQETDSKQLTPQKSLTQPWGQLLHSSTVEFPLPLTFRTQYVQSHPETPRPCATYAEFHAEGGIGNNGWNLKWGSDDLQDSRLWGESKRPELEGLLDSSQRLWWRW